ncbi:MAG TPA: hypothetical protein VNH18_06275 [Bryobacteraceae bacterium]|nr:hypothetical protein [Bryobacteraceae bacterium]
MQLDPEYLRRHYDSLSDEALQAVDRNELVEMAQTILDEEIARRGLVRSRDARRTRIIPTQPDTPDAEAYLDSEPPDTGDKPGWLEDAAEVYSRTVFTGTAPAPDAANARDVLEAAGIPCYLDLSEIPQEKGAGPEPTHQWRLMVPGEMNLRATSVLERDIFNPDFEADWKTHLETVSDADLRAMNPEAVFCGLFDRIERVNRVYDEEIARRKLKS